MSAAHDAPAWRTREAPTHGERMARLREAVELLQSQGHGYAAQVLDAVLQSVAAAPSKREAMRP